MSEIRQIHAPNLIALMADEATGSDFSGRLKHLYDDREFSFSGSGDLLVQMDDLYDDWNFPQRAYEQRYFGRNASAQDKSRRDYLRIEERERVRSVDDLYAMQGTLATFVIFVEYRQNASWQGTAQWLEGGETQRFSSALELLKMIDAALKKAPHKKAV